MIDHQHGYVIFACDSCDETFTLDTDDFDVTWSAAKREGWRAEKLGNDWLHTCPECQGK